MREEHTKRLIAAGLKETVRSVPLKKLTVQELCNRCQITRGTFYYHFRDLSDLVCWVYRTEVTLPARRILLEDPFHSGRSTLYALQTAFAARDLYCQALQEQGQNNLREFALQDAEESWTLLWQSYLQSRRRVERPDSGIRHILRYFASAHQNAVLSWVNEGMKESPEQVADLIEQASQTGLLAAFEKASLPQA